MAKRFDLNRQMETKRRLNAQLVKADNDARLKSLLKRYYILGVALQNMNLRAGHQPRIDITKLSFESQFMQIKAYQQKLLGAKI